MKKKYSIIIYISLLAAFFIWGFISATHKTFPYPLVRDIYWKFNKQNVPTVNNKEVINYINNFLLQLTYFPKRKKRTAGEFKLFIEILPYKYTFRSP